MENKAKDMCPRCKYCLGMTPQGMYSCGKANDGSELNIGIDVVLNCANFEWKDGKVEGKAGDICPKCKNCKGIIQEYNGKTASIRLTEVECEDPYDGMIKTLAADSDVCCSMFCDYVTGNCPSYVEKKEKESCDGISCLQHELEMDKLRRTIHELEKEKAAHLKGIERLKKSQEKLQNQVKNLKIYEDENKSMYEDLKYWRERCHGAETDVTTLNSKVETLKNKKDKYLKKILDLENMANKLQSGEYDDILAKDIEIKSLQDKYEAAMAGWKDAIDTNDKMIGEKDKQIEELTRRYNMIAKKLNDIHDILKEDETNERYH